MMEINISRDDVAKPIKIKLDKKNLYIAMAIVFFGLTFVI